MTQAGSKKREKNLIQKMSDTGKQFFVPIASVGLSLSALLLLLNYIHGKSVDEKSKIVLKLLQQSGLF